MSIFLYKTVSDPMGQVELAFSGYKEMYNWSMEGETWEEGGRNDDSAGLA